MGVYDETRSNTPSVSLVFPPVGWHSTLVHEGQTTTTCACEKTVVMVKQPEWKNESYDWGTPNANIPGHLTSIKYELGSGTGPLSLWSLGRRWLTSTARTFVELRRLFKLQERWPYHCDFFCVVVEWKQGLVMKSGVLNSCAVRHRYGTRAY